MGVNANEVQHSFQAEWLETASGLVRRYILTYFESDNSVQMQHHPLSASSGLFLKRHAVPGLTTDQMYIGAKITFLGRTIKLTDFADSSTESALGGAQEKTFMLIKPGAYQNTGKIMSEVNAMGLTFSSIKMVKLNKEYARQLFDCDNSEAEYLCSDVCTAVEVLGAGATAALANAAPGFAQKYGQDGRDAIHASASEADAQKDFKTFNAFSSEILQTALFSNCTLGIIRPSAMANAGQIVDDILRNNFEISAMQQFSLEMCESKKFLEVYNQVLPEYPELVKELCSGPCLAMEIRQENAVNAFRDLVGPHDPEIAKLLRPNTMRSKYGLDRGRNAVHCTDLPEDGQLEVEYFFKELLKLQE